MKCIILAAPLLVTLSACGESPTEAAIKEYEMVGNLTSVTNGEKCRAAQKVEAAVLEAHDEAAYKEWHMRAYLDCAAPAGQLAAP
ncbi:hypothetical protein [Novosphingobium sp. AP12]|uniref:hypothetical protein n=1 Tax=Novosphingobium sp. AP12 TaxID=1144305 RepID=UPI000271DDF9|nr:hypothetical protein [Novosphingobium sp. AP12]EJL21891.1 hypothetical protein PMI02_04876 [Novosphingobium sp. AP12]